MRERYESLPATVLKELAKARGLKETSTMPKRELIECLLKKHQFTTL